MKGGMGIGLKYPTDDLYSLPPLPFSPPEDFSFSSLLPGGRGVYRSAKPTKKTSTLNLRLVRRNIFLQFLFSPPPHPLLLTRCVRSLMAVITAGQWLRDLARWRERREEIRQKVLKAIARGCCGPSYSLPPLFPSSLSSEQPYPTMSAELHDGDCR